MSDIDYQSFVNAANSIRKVLDFKPDDQKIGYQVSPGGIINAYREGDLNFIEATKEIEALTTNTHKPPPFKTVLKFWVSGGNDISIGDLYKFITGNDPV